MNQSIQANSENGRLIRKLEVYFDKEDRKSFFITGKNSGPEGALITNIEREVRGENVSYHIWVEDPDGLVTPWKTYDNCKVAVEYDLKDPLK